MKRLAIITTHPIQYYAPLFRMLSKRKNILIKVFYTWDKNEALYDIDFKKSFEWDIPLLEGYEYCYASSSLIREIENWGAQAVLVFGWNFSHHLKAMRYFKKKIPVLFRGDSTLLDEEPGLRRILRRLFLTWVYRHLDFGLYVGTNNKKYFQVHGVREDQLIFAPHAIDNDRFYDKDGKYGEEAKKIRSELGIPDNDILFTFVGKFQEKKNPLFIVNAFIKLAMPNVHLLMVGNGVLEPILKEKARENKNIHFMEFQNQSRMPVVYRIGEVFCLPSKGPEETWGLAVNEAMASERAVLVSDRCGCSIDLVENKRNGFRFRSGDMNDLLDKIKLFLEQKDTIKVKGRESAEIIKNWSYDQCAPVIEKIVLNIHAV